MCYNRLSKLTSRGVPAAEGGLGMGNRKLRRLLVWPLAVLLVLTLAPGRGRAVLEGVYFTAANEQLLDLTDETMPFYSGGVLYVSSDVFAGTDLGVTFVYNSTTKTAMLYTARTDLRFDLANQTTRDKYGNRYQTYALERNGHVFLPLSTVCNFFDLTWTFNDTNTAPLIRVRSGSAILSDRDFIDAAANDMQRRYAAYEKLVEESTDDDPQVYPGYSGQRVHLLVACESREDTLAVLSALGEEAQATFLLTAEQMADGDLLRALIAGGHGVALAASGETEEAVEAQVMEGRDRLWQAACSWLSLVWHEGPADMAPLLSELGCVSLGVDLDRRDTGLGTASRARSLLNAVELYRRDLTIHLGSDSGCLGGLDTLLAGLEDMRCQVCAWRP